MAGLLRNLITLLFALPHWGRSSASQMLSLQCWVTPLDIGMSRLKSDRYLQFAECAQLDFIVRSGLLGRLLKKRYNFVNAAQLIRFNQPISVFSCLRIETRVLWFDQRWAYFQHDFRQGEQLCARVLVKMKFKQQRLTIAPSEIMNFTPERPPAELEAWNQTLLALEQNT